MKNFDIPIVLFFFRRSEKIVKIIEVLSVIKPQKLYLISDGPRNSSEEIEVNNCREAVENAINWNCNIIKNYAPVNKGVYDRIGLGAKWVFEQEEKAIFLEDDNLPDQSFFKFCEELLEKFVDDSRVLWICGTNYLENYEPEDGASYVFTKHLMPCGWASWSDKFQKYYDGELELLNDKSLVERIKKQYTNKALSRQQLHSFYRTKHLLNVDPRSSSWDHQMAFSIRAHNVFGIAPKVNLIKNIGVDEFSEHGGNSFSNEMTRRFCGMDLLSLEFPLVHPKTVLQDIEYERKIGNLILYPFHIRLGRNVIRLIKPILGINKYDSFNEWIKSRGK